MRKTVPAIITTFCDGSGCGAEVPYSVHNRPPGWKSVVITEIGMMGGGIAYDVCPDCHSRLINTLLAPPPVAAVIGPETKP